MPLSAADLAIGETRRLGRALTSQIAAVTVGARPTGTARVVATASGTIPPNAYAFPVVDGVMRQAKLLKTSFNPATVLPHNTGGAWPVGPAGSNVGFVGVDGGTWKVEPGSLIRFDPPIPGVDELPVVNAPGIRGGGHDAALARAVALYDDIDQPTEIDGFRALAANGPMVIVGWLKSAPDTMGMPAARGRVGANSRMYVDDWFALVFSTTGSSGEARWSEGVAIAEAIRGCLIDRKRNLDGETLDRKNGIEVNNVSRVNPDKTNLQMFRVDFRTRSIHAGVNARLFPPWLETRYRAFREAVLDVNGDPTNEELTLVDALDQMPRDTP